MDEIRDCANQLAVETRLQTYRSALNTVDHPVLKGSRYYLLVLDSQQGTQSITVTGYKPADLDAASAHYLRVEQEVKESGGDAVLVSVDSIAALRNAYPNYFLDTTRFLGELRKTLSGNDS